MKNSEKITDKLTRRLEEEASKIIKEEFSKYREELNQGVDSSEDLLRGRIIYKLPIKKD